MSADIKLDEKIDSGTFTVEEAFQRGTQILLKEHSERNPVSFTSFGTYDIVYREACQYLVDRGMRAGMVESYAQAIVDKARDHAEEQLGHSDVIIVSIGVGDRPPMQFGEGAISILYYSGKGNSADFAGKSDINVRLTASGTATTSNCADVAVMFSKFGFYAVSETASKSTLQGMAQDAAIGMAADIAGGGMSADQAELIADKAEFLTNMEVDGEPILASAEVKNIVEAVQGIQEAVQSGDMQAVTVASDNALSSLSTAIKADVISPAQVTDIASNITKTVDTVSEQIKSDQTVQTPANKNDATPTVANNDNSPTATVAENSQTVDAPKAETQSVEAPKAEAPKAEAPKAEAPKAEAPKAEAPKAEAPKAEAPKAEAPKAEAPKAEAPKAEAPKAEAPKAEAPKAEAPKAEAPKAEAPKAEAPKAEAPKAEAPKAEAPKAEAPKAEAPKAEAPKAEAPKAEAPKAEAPKAEAPKAEAPKAEAPKAEAPKAEAPKAEAPKAEAPKAEAPKAEAPKAEAPKAEAPKAEAPKAEAPKAEAPKAEAPKAEAPKAEAPVIKAANNNQPGDQTAPQQQGQQQRTEQSPQQPRQETSEPSSQKSNEGPPSDEKTDEIKFEKGCKTGCGCAKCTGGFNNAAKNDSAPVVEAKVELASVQQDNSTTVAETSKEQQRTKEPVSACGRAGGCGGCSGCGPKFNVVAKQTSGTAPKASKEVKAAPMPKAA